MKECKCITCPRVLNVGALDHTELPLQCRLCKERIAKGPLLRTVEAFELLARSVNAIALHYSAEAPGRRRREEIHTNKNTHDGNGPYPPRKLYL